MANNKSTIRTTTIQMSGSKAKPQPPKKATAKRKPLSEKEKLKRAKAKARAREQAKRKAQRQKMRMRRWTRIHQSGITHWILTAIVAVAILFFFYRFFIRPYSYRWKPCYGSKGYGVCLPLGYKVHGIDASHHQGTIDWKAIKATEKQKDPIRFAFIKATEGGDYKDRLFSENFRQAAEAGLVRGAYHFYNPNTDPIKQADFFISQVKLTKGDLAPVLDIERKPRDKAKLQADLKKFLNRLEQHYGIKPIIYTSYKYRLRYLDSPEFNAYPFWIAHYYVDNLSYEGEWNFWQHTDYGTVPGIDTNVDLNVFNGTWEELSKYRIK